MYLESNSHIPLQFHHMASWAYTQHTQFSPVIRARLETLERRRLNNNEIHENPFSYVCCLADLHIISGYQYTRGGYYRFINIILDLEILGDHRVRFPQFTDDKTKTQRATVTHTWSYNLSLAWYWTKYVFTWQPVTLGHHLYLCGQSREGENIGLVLKLPLPVLMLI